MIVKGETARKFRFGIAIDAPYPNHLAQQLIAPYATQEKTQAPPAGATSGWFFHLNAKNVEATSWQPTSKKGVCTGFSVRLLERMGRPANLNLQCFRDLKSAKVVNFEGVLDRECELADGGAVVPIQAHQWLQVDVEFE